MGEIFKVHTNLVGSFVKDELGNVVDEMFPRNTKFEFDGNTIIGDVRDKKCKYNYKVVSYVEGRIVACFHCADVEKLETGKYKLTLLSQDEDSYEGKSFLFNPETGRIASHVYDAMGYLADQKLFLCKSSVKTRRGSFDYYVKVDLEGKEVTNLYNDYTEEEVPLEERVNDENKTLNLIAENARKRYLKCYSLEPRKETE